MSERAAFITGVCALLLGLFIGGYIVRNCWKTQMIAVGAAEYVQDDPLEDDRTYRLTPDAASREKEFWQAQQARRDKR